MKRIRKISSYLVTAAMLVSGNFSFALTHIDCIIDQTAHHKCEMECCKESDCCEPVENFAKESIADDVTCCEVHVEEAAEPDFAVLHLGSPNDYSKTEILKGLDVIIDHKREFTRLITHKLKTTNIYLSVSNLRI